MSFLGGSAFEEPFSGFHAIVEKNVMERLEVPFDLFQAKTARSTRVTPRNELTGVCQGIPRSCIAQSKQIHSLLIRQASISLTLFLPLVAL